MIENKLRKKLAKTQTEIWIWETKYKSSKNKNSKKKAEDKLTYLIGKEAGLLEAIKILWGEKYKDKIEKEDI